MRTASQPDLDEGARGSPSKPAKLTRSPMAQPSGGVSSSTLVCSSLEAAITIADDSTLRILAGLRLHRRSARRLTRASAGM